MSLSDYVVEEGYWRNPLDITLYMTHYGQAFRYFHQHIQQVPSIASEESFHHYVELPAELQLRIMQHCDAPTLFQLMHTTRDIRVEARKLFFSHPPTWYRLQADFLLLRPSAGETLYDPAFLASVTQLEIHAPYMNSRVWKPDVEGKTFASAEERSEYVDRHVKAEIQAFWRAVKRLCPRVRRVMFTRDGTSFPDKDVMMDCFQPMARLCPQSLDVFFYTNESAREFYRRRRKRILWRLRSSDEDAAIETTPQPEQHAASPIMIVIPPQKRHRGRVGDFIRAQTVWEKSYSLGFAAEMYRAAATEQQHFLGRHEPFGCSDAECDAWFDQPEQYTTHLLATHHGKGETPSGRAGALVRANTQLKLALERETKDRHNAFWDWWGQQRTAAESEVMRQLEHDALYAQEKPVAQHFLLQSMYQVENSNAM